MSNWKGNTYNRNKELPKFLANINQEKLQEYGIKKINKKFMTDYNYGSEDKKIQSIHNNQTVTQITLLGNTNKINGV